MFKLGWYCAPSRSSLETFGYRDIDSSASQGIPTGALRTGVGNVWPSLASDVLWRMDVSIDGPASGCGGGMDDGSAVPLPANSSNPDDLRDGSALLL